MNAPDPLPPQPNFTIAAALADVARRAADLLSAHAPPPASADPAAPAPGDRLAVPMPILQVAANIATHAWRAQRKMIDPASGQPRDEMKRVARHIEEILKSLRQLGLEIDDPEGRPYDTGMDLKVVTFEPVPGLSREEITETLRPSIRLQGHALQQGEVVVGTPVNS